MAAPADLGKRGGSPSVQRLCLSQPHKSASDHPRQSENLQELRTTEDNHIFLKDHGHSSQDKECE